MKLSVALGVFALALVPLAASAYVIAKAPTPLRIMIRAPQPEPVRAKAARTEIWYFISLGDCRAGNATVDSLNRLNAQEGVRVIGVLLETPDDSVEAARLAASFETDFPLLPDYKRQWAEILRSEGYAPPVVAVLERDSLRAVFSRGTGITAVAPLLAEAVRPELVESQRSDEALPAPSGRRYKALPWSREVRIVSTATAPLQRPELIAVGRDRVAVFDYGDHLLKAYDLDGRHLWSYGARERGESPFDNPLDLKITESGEVMILDPATHRITRFDSKGKVSSFLRLSRPVDRFALVASGAIVGVQTPARNLLGEVFAADGQPATSISVPDEVRGVEPLARASLAAAIPGTDSVVIGYGYSDVLTIWNGRELGRSVAGVEQVGFPDVLRWKDARGNTLMRVGPRAVTGAISLSADAAHVFVLFGGRSNDAGRLVDVYGHDGRYAHSYRLPEPVLAMVVSAERLVTARSLPRAEISVWRHSAR